MTPDGAHGPAEPVCAWCGEPIGRVMVAKGHENTHQECFLRMVVGGVNHQRHLCSCYGGTEEPDPPDLTLREAAQVAYDCYRALYLAGRAGGQAND